MNSGQATSERIPTLLAILAHPDDESLAAGSTLAAYAAAGADVHLVTATRGERGRFFDDSARPDDAEVGRVREREIHAAAAVLGLRSTQLLGLPDGGLGRVEPAPVIGEIRDRILETRPHVVLTFDAFGAYGHPDHIAVSQFAQTAVVAAAAGPLDRHRVDKVYHLVETTESWAAYERAFQRRLGTTVDGVRREAVGWPEWAVTTRVDTRSSWRTAWRAIRCHESQMAIYGHLADLPDPRLEELWRYKSFYRAIGSGPDDGTREADLFAGIADVLPGV